jgi:16S rRNA (uracil1498-N3)-methyltransferase
MNNPRVYVDPPLQEGQQFALDPATSHHMMRVLRLNVGQIITVCDGQGNDYRATLLPPRGQGRQLQVWVELGSCEPNRAEASHSVHIAVAPISGERFERMLEQLAELGVVAVTPLLTERTNVRQLSEPKLQRWRRVATEASQLAGRGSPLRIQPPLRLSQYLQTHSHGCMLHQASSLAPTQRLEYKHLLVGPEGGFSAAEVSLATGRGWHTWSLGPRNLRVETAALVGAVLSLH